MTAIRSPRIRPPALLLLLFPAVLDAQESRDTTSLPPIVVTATRLPTPADRISGRVSVVTAAELRAAGVTTVTEALAGLVGLAVVQTGPYGSGTAVFVRGGESDYVKVLVDGVPVNEPGGAYDFANLTVDNVDRIEVVRGPVSVLYGSDAVAGVVQIFTRAGGRRVDAGARVGTYGTFETDASAGADVGPVAVAITARRTASDGSYAFNNEYDNRVLGGRLHLAPDGRTTVDVALRNTDADYHFPTDGAGNPVDRNQHQLSAVTTIGADAARRLSDRVEVRLALASNAGDGTIEDEPDGPGDTLGMYAYHSQQHVTRRGADGRMVVALGGSGTLTAGGAFEDQRLRGSSASESEFGPFTSTTDAQRGNWAAYSQLDVPVGRMSVVAGARLDRNERFGTFVTWRGGATWRPAAGWRFYASAGTAFKEPTFFEQFGGGFVIGNPGLAPERTTSWEVGGERALLDRRLHASASYFGQRFRDLIQFTLTPPTPDGPNYLNVAAASADGLELEIRLAPASGVRLTAHYGFLRTRVTDAGVLPDDDAAFRAGDRLLRRPTHSAGLETTARLGSATLYAGLRWTGDRADADFTTYPAVRVTLPAVAVANLGADVPVLSAGRGLPGLVLTARVENLFDARYQQAYGFPARGRVVLVGCRVRT